jgi:dihydroxy-acid dehydratase
VRRPRRAGGGRWRADRVGARRRPHPPRRRRPRYTTGILAKYVKLVNSAAIGAVCG